MSNYYVFEDIWNAGVQTLITNQFNLSKWSKSVSFISNILSYHRMYMSKILALNNNYIAFNIIAKQNSVKSNKNNIQVIGVQPTVEFNVWLNLWFEVLK
jgi:hypothetical protein